MNPAPNRDAQSGARPGRGPFIAFWVLLLAGLYWGFDSWYERKLNPNTVAALATQRGELSLQQNMSGAYVADGELNGERVTFLVDTGADSVALSMRRATALGLKRGAAITVMTAGGPAAAYETRIERVRIGPIEQADVRAVMVEGMDDRMVLLGMTFLRRVEFGQRDGVLTLRPATPR
ncbi:MAG: TIGR02281 family clan AA aspartic protease [Burkholderiales bacterium]